MPQKIHPNLRDYDWLYDEYINKCNSQEAIAKMLGVCGSSVIRAMRRLNIPSRSLKSAESIRWRNVISLIPELNDKKWIENKYIQEGTEPEQIAVELGCTFETVLSSLKKHGIPIRSRSITGNRLRRDAIKELRDFDWLYDEYINKNRSISDIATELKCSGHTVITYLKRWRIRRREILYIDKEMRKRTKDRGYIVVFRPDHPNAASSGWILEHRLIVSDLLGRPLTDKEVVHHLNLKPDDNRPENLLVFSNSSKHKSFHENPPDWIPKCECCGHILHERLERRPDNVPLYFG